MERDEEKKTIWINLNLICLNVFEIKFTSVHLPLKKKEFVDLR